MTGPIENPWLSMALNNAWSNATLYAAVIPLGQRWADPRPGFFGSIKRTLNHIHEVDLFYVDALEEGGFGRSVYDADDIDAPEDLNRRQADIDQRFSVFCRTTAPAVLDRTRMVERPIGPTHETVGALILHLVQHQIHHRGQVHAMLSDAGIAPPQLDDFHLEHDRAPTAMPYWS